MKLLKYDNNLELKVEKEFTVERLMEFFHDLDDALEKCVEIIAVGGTALELMGLKTVTKDIDFFIKGMNYDEFSKTLENISGKYGRVDFWEDGRMMLHKNGRVFDKKMPQDYSQLAQQVNLSFDRILLKTLNPLDIIITKADRCSLDDMRDIHAIKEAFEIKKEELEERFKLYIPEYNGSVERYKSNFRYIIDTLYG